MKTTETADKKWCLTYLAVDKNFSPVSLMTEVASSRNLHHISTSSISKHHRISEKNLHLKLDSNSTVSTSSVTSISPESPSFHLAVPEAHTNSSRRRKAGLDRKETKTPCVYGEEVKIKVNNKPTPQKIIVSNQVLFRPKAHVLSLHVTSDSSPITTNAITDKSEQNNTSAVETTTTRPLVTVSDSAQRQGPKIVRPAPLKNNGQNKNSSVQVQKLQKKENIEPKRQQNHQGQQQQVLNRQNYQQHQNATALRKKEELTARRKKQLNQCNFPPTQPTVQSSNNRAVNNSNISGRPTYQNMGSTDRSNLNQHSSQVKIMSQSQQNYVVRQTSRSTSSSASVEKAILLHNGHNFNSNHQPESPMDSSNHQPPLFERLVTEEAHDRERYIKRIDFLEQRLIQMQSVQDDLEHRLEQFTKEKLFMEKEWEELNSKWIKQCNGLEGERNTWIKLCSDERGKNERLSNMMNRKDKEIQRMIQKKYDSGKGQGHGHSHSTHMKRSESYRGSSSSKAQSTMMQGVNPYYLVVQKGSSEAVRKRNVMQSLLDFFGM